MSARRRAREWALQILFQGDYQHEVEPEVLEVFWADRQTSAKVREFTEQLVRGVQDHREELDGVIRRYAENWDIERIARVDRNIIRLALFEILHCPEVPAAAAINEAIEIAKDFSTSESGRFVNGILDRVRRDRDAGRLSAPAAG